MAERAVSLIVMTRVTAGQESMKWEGGERERDSHSSYRSQVSKRLLSEGVVSRATGQPATAHELAGLRAHGNALESSLDSARNELHTHGDALKEVAIVRAEHGFTAATSARLEQGVAEQGRLLSDLRTEVASLSQRHVALNSSVRSEQSAATQVTSALRSTAEAQAMQIDVLSAKLVTLGGSGNDESGRAVDKLNSTGTCLGMQRASAARAGLAGIAHVMSCGQKGKEGAGGMKRLMGSPFFESLTTPRTTRLGSRSSAKRLVRSMSCTRMASHAHMRNERAKKRATELTGSAERCSR
eukprot:scaffold2151_cov99-Isochrysis_galbana.AAC.5